MPSRTDTKIDSQEKEQEDTEGSSDSGNWCVMLFNDEVHTFDEVIHWLVKYADQNKTKAKNIAVIVDMRGKGVCYTGSKSECEDVKENLEGKGLDVKVKERSSNES